MPGIPQLPQARSFLKIILIAVPVLLLIGGGIFGYMYFMGTGEVPVPSESPTASVEPTSTPQSGLLDQLFGLNQAAIPVVASANPVADFYGLIEKVSLDPKQLKKVVPDGESTGLGFLDLLERFLVPHPAELKSMLTGEKIVLLFGQTEGFDDRGVAIPTAANPQQRLAFITAVGDQSSAAQSMSAWEATIGRDLADLFKLDPSKAALPNFSESNYNGKTIRYMNFSYPDRSIDYSFVTVSDGKTYLVITGSRESMYSILDILR